MKAGDMQVGETYRFQATDYPGDTAGTVKVSKLEWEDGVFYVHGFYRHDTGGEPLGEGCGVFNRNDTVTEVNR